MVRRIAENRLCGWTLLSGCGMMAQIARTGGYGIRPASISDYFHQRDADGDAHCEHHCGEVLRFPPFTSLGGEPFPQDAICLGGKIILAYSAYVCALAEHKICLSEQSRPRILDIVHFLLATSEHPPTSDNDLPHYLPRSGGIIQKSE